MQNLQRQKLINIQFGKKVKVLSFERAISEEESFILFILGEQIRTQIQL